VIEPNFLTPGPELKSTLAEAARSERPIVILFEPRGTNDSLRGQGFKDMCGDKAIFVRCVLPSRVERMDRNHVWRESRLLHDDIPAAYGARAGRTTIVVADWHGNPWFSPSPRTAPAQLERMLEQVADKVKEANESLQSNVDAANEALEEGNRRQAFTVLRRGMRDGLVGIEGAKNLMKTYDELIEAGKKEVEEAVKAGDTEKLEELAREFNGTEVADAAREAQRRD
jgi:hypothetical protein